MRSRLLLRKRTIDQLPEQHKTSCSDACVRVREFFAVLFFGDGFEFFDRFVGQDNSAGRTEPSKTMFSG